MADLPRGFNDDFSSFARGGSDGVKNTKKQHGLLTSDGQKTVLLCCLVRAWGLEPQRLAAREPKSRMSANSIMPANRTTIAQLGPRGKEKNRKTVWEKVKQKMPCFFNKLFCVILCILSSTNRPPAKAPPVACVLSCYFRVLCVRFSLKYERAGAARPPPPSTRPAPCSHSARLKPFAGSCSSRFGFA